MKRYATAAVFKEALEARLRDLVVTDDILGFVGVTPPTLRIYPLEASDGGLDHFV